MRRKEDEAGNEVQITTHPNPIATANQPTFSPIRAAQRWLSLYWSKPAAAPPRAWNLPNRQTLFAQPDKLKALALHRAQDITLAHYLAGNPPLPTIRWLQLLGKLIELALKTECRFSLDPQLIHYDAVTEKVFLGKSQAGTPTIGNIAQLISNVLGFTLHQDTLLITPKTVSRITTATECEFWQGFLQAKLNNQTLVEREWLTDLEQCLDEHALQCRDIMSAIRKVALVDLAE